MPNALSCAESRSCNAALKGVEDGAEENYSALDELFVAGFVDSDERKAVEDEGEEEPAESATQNSPSTSGKARTAYHYNRDRIELQAVTQGDFGIGIAVDSELHPRRHEHADSENDVGNELRSLNVESAEARGFAV